MNAIAPEFQAHAEAFEHWDADQAEQDRARQHAIDTGKVCPYCGLASKLVNDATVYHGQTYGGKVYLCEPCQAWVGCHGNSSKALGRLANASLRDAKQKAHRAFDRLWKARSSWVETARQKAYAWLSLRLHIHPDRCHIGMFDVDQCRSVVELCFAPHAQFDYDNFLMEGKK